MHPPATSWQLRTRTLTVGKIPLLMGIVNVTPDSFSDGGMFIEPEKAIELGLRLAAEGAAILDIGGESTRPGSEPVDADQELRRVMPVITALSEQTSLPVSIDTSKSLVAREALSAGAEIVNDVTALSGDCDMVPLAAESGCGVCVMHMQGMPRTMQQSPTYDNVVEDVIDYLRIRRDALTAIGLRQSQIALDPGIGFGKTLEHNLALLSGMQRFHELGCPLLVGHSRKRFIGEVLGDDQADRTAGTIGVSVSLAQQGVQILRVHDVARVRQGLMLWEAARPHAGR
jgi:dihydropteroate synthase